MRMPACPRALIDAAQTKASDEMQCKLDELASQKSAAASERAMSASIDRVVKLAIKKVRERSTRLGLHVQSIMCRSRFIFCNL